MLDGSLEGLLEALSLPDDESALSEGSSSSLLLVLPPLEFPWL
jgi:hypothetical protein